MKEYTSTRKTSKVTINDVCDGKDGCARRQLSETVPHAGRDTSFLVRCCPVGGNPRFEKRGLS